MKALGINQLLLESPAIMAGSLIESKTRFLSINSIELWGRIKLLLQEKQTGKISEIFNEETVAIVGKLLEYKCISTKPHKFLLVKRLN